ncbi:MAG TPA: FAD/NAD(P)-binding protein [Solirubrobacteraceae bacterium]
MERVSQHPGSGSPGTAGARRTVAIVGAGAAGTLSAVALARAARAARTPLEILLLDRRDFGPGVAYSTPDPLHTLNVPARDMSAFADEPDDFVQWRRRRGSDGGPRDFAPRAEYGEYLRDVLHGALGEAGGVALRTRTAEVRALHRQNRGFVLALAGGETVACDEAVLALGTFPPGDTPGLAPEALAHPRHVADPWAPGALDAVRDDGLAVLVGSGLTMVDVALTLARRAPRLHLHAISRNGLLPHAHDPALPPRAAPVVAPGASLAATARALREAPGPWRPVVDGLRPVAAELWQGFDAADRRAFLAGHARRWDVLRHRMPPAVATAIGELRAAGRLTTTRASVAAIRPERHGLAVWRAGEPAPLPAAWVVNCTGPCADVTRVRDPLVAHLLASGHARPHPLGLGLDTAGGAVLDARGGRTGGLWTLGSLRRGELYETTALPEIRRQAAELGARLARGVAEPLAA